MDFWCLMCDFGQLGLRILWCSGWGFVCVFYGLLDLITLLCGYFCVSGFIVLGCLYYSLGGYFICG